MGIDTSFSTALGMMPTARDRVEAFLSARQSVEHAMNKAGIPSGIGGGLRRAPQQQEMGIGGALKQGLGLYNTWQDSRNYSSGNAWDIGAAGFKDNYSSGLDAPFFDSGGMTYWDSGSDTTIPTNTFNLGANSLAAETAAGLGSDNNWFQGIKNWFSGG